MIYWFKYMPEKIIQIPKDELFPVIKNEWVRKNYNLLANSLAIFICIAIYLFFRDDLANIARISLNVMPFSLDTTGGKILSVVIFVSIFALITLVISVIHELLHMAVVYGKDDMSVTLSKWGIFVTTNADLSKTQKFIVVSLPLIVLTVIPFIISFFMPSDIAGVVRYFAGFNFAFSAYDIITISQIISKPKNAVFWRGMYYIPKG